MFYLDTSFVAPLILEEPASEQIEGFVATLPAGELFISHWTRVELASLMAREVRMGGLAEVDALSAIAQFDDLVVDSFQVLIPSVSDYELAKGYVQHFAAKLRAGDALHLAIARNNAVSILYTLDKGLMRAAEIMTIPAGPGIEI